MDEKIDTMMKAGVVEPLKSGSDYNSPVFLVRKGNKSKPFSNSDSVDARSYRVVADLRNLNKNCLSDNFELPNLNHVLDTIGSDKFFSVFDLSSSFHQIPYSEESKQYTAFMYRNRQLCFARMIMGFKGSSSSFSRMMSKLLTTVPISQLIFFIDDLFLSSQDISSHIDRLEVLLQRLRSAGLKLTPKKCELLKRQVTFVGIDVTGEGIKINSDRVVALTSMPRPKSVKDVQRILGAFNFVRKWIPQFSAITKPLHNLNRKGQKFEWTNEHEQSFKTLKHAAAAATTLAIPQPDDPQQSYIVTVDASNRGYGATLSQEQEGERKIVAFFSKAVPPYKRSYGQTRLEFDAMYLAIIHWEVYLRNTKFRVRTDCKGLVATNDSLFKKSDPALVRKCLKLAKFDFTIEHLSGLSNSLCDFLSRFPFNPKHLEKSTQTLTNDSTPSAPANILSAPNTIAQINDSNHNVFSGVHTFTNMSNIESNIPLVVNRPDNVINPNIPSVANASIDVINPKIPSFVNVLDDNTNSLSVVNASNSIANTNSLPVVHKSINANHGLSAVDISHKLINPNNVSVSEPDTSVPYADPPKKPIKLDPVIRIVPSSDIDTKSSRNDDTESMLPNFDKDFDAMGIVSLFENGNKGCQNPKVILFNREKESVCTCSVPDMTRVSRPYREEECVNSVDNPRTTPTFDIEHLKREQDQDPVLRLVKDWIKTGNKGKISWNRVPNILVSYWRQFKNLVIEDGVLKRAWMDSEGNTTRKLIVIPDSCLIYVFKLFHDDISLCHPGAYLSAEKCLQHFYYPNLREEMSVKSCIKCSLTKQPKAYGKAPLKQITFHRFNDCIVVDHIVPSAVNKTPRGNRYILTISDGYSNLLTAIAVRTQTSAENIKALRQHWITKFGMPHEIIVDNHPGFSNQLFKDFFATFNCKVTKGTSYGKSSTARAENNNKRVNQALRAVIPLNKEHDWDLYLNDSVFALNSLRNKRTGFSSHMMVYGQELNTPLSVMMCKGELSGDHGQPVHTKIKELQQRLRNIYRKVRDNSDRDFLVAKRYHDKNLHITEYQGRRELFHSRCVPQAQNGPSMVRTIPHNKNHK